MGVSTSAAARIAIGRAACGTMSEINVTPLVDVMLVLLIVFMVAAPLLTVGVAVDLPETAAQPIPGPGEPLDRYHNRRRHRFSLQETAVEIDALVPQLEAIAPPATISASSSAAIRRALMARSCASWAGSMRPGFRRIGLVTDRELE